MKRLFLLFLILLAIVFGPLPILAEKPILTIDTGGHKAMVRDVMFTSDGRYLVSASDDRTVRVWDLSTARVKKKMLGKGKMVWSAGLAEDGRSIACGEDL